MQDDLGIVLQALRIVLFWLSPLLFLLGIVIALYSNYRMLEEKLAKNIIPIKLKRVIMIETNIYTLHEWLMSRRILIGLIAVVASVVFYLMFKP